MKYNNTITHKQRSKIAAILMAFFLVNIQFAFTQVGIGTKTPNASAGLDLSFANKGFLLPRLALTGTGDLSTVPTPATSLLIYNTATAGAGITAVIPGFYFFNGSAWSPLSASTGSATGGWSLSGNAGTNAALNFIGTTDNQLLKFRQMNEPSGFLDAFNENVALGSHSLDSIKGGGMNNAIGSQALTNNKIGNHNNAFGRRALFSNIDGWRNTALGTSALVNSTNGNDNIAVGFNAAYGNVTGSNNVAIGNTALYGNNNGNGNTAVGFNAAYSNVSGFSNVAVGTNSLYKNISGVRLIAIGDSALYNNTAGDNVAIGSKALRYNETGVLNTAIGNQSLFSNSSGSQNTAVGRAALYWNNNGSQNTALGFQSLYNNQYGSRNTGVGYNSLIINLASNDNTAVGYRSLTKNEGNNNTAVGSNALNANENGVGNTATGVSSLDANVSGNFNAAFGHGALLKNTTGIYNVALGTSALTTNTSGYNNTAIGAGADVYGTNYVNATAVGANAQVSCSNCMVLGSIAGYNYGTTNSKIGIGTTSPQKTLHVNPNGQGGVSIGKDLVTGGYTALHMGISQESGGYSFLQSVKASGQTYGNLALNLNGGDVGIKTIPLALLHLKQNVDEYPITNGGIRIENWYNGSHWDFGMDGVRNLSFSYNGAAKFYFDDVDGEMYTVSDRRMKKDIKAVDNVLPGIMRLQAKTYHYIDNENNARSSYGFIAQEVEEIFPGFVSTKGKDNLKAIGYQKINVMAVKAIQEQQAIIENQNERIAALESKLDQLIRSVGNK
ncbi:MAG: tail fiber domain-containing protein [Bacteroidota bacterium]